MDILKSSHRMNIEELAVNYLVRKNLIKQSGLFDNIKGKVILDIGAGTGAIAKKMYEKGAEVICLDIDRNNVREIKKSFPSVTAYVADAHNLEFLGHNCVDIVLCSAVIEHFENPMKVLNNVYRLLKVGGILYLSIDIKPRIAASIRKFAISRVIKNLSSNHPEIHKVTQFSETDFFYFLNEKKLIEYLNTIGFVNASTTYGGGILTNFLDCVLLVIERFTRKGFENNLSDHTYRLNTLPVKIYLTLVWPVLKFLSKIENYKAGSFICLVKLKKSLSVAPFERC